MVAQRSVVAAVLLTCLGALPIFLSGALTPFIAADLGFDEPQIGATVAAYFLVSAVLSSWAGVLAERLGGRTSGSLAAAVSVASLLGVCFVAGDWLSLTVFVAIGGAGNALGQLASNLLIARSVTPGRFGLAYGIKQSALPAASLIGGLSVPLIGLTLGWRWAFALGAGLALAWLALAPRDSTERPARRAAPVATFDRRALVPLALAVCLSAAAANTLGAFFVASSTAAGIPVGLAGVLLAIGGGLSIVARVGFGATADRRSRDELRTVGAMMLAGSLAGVLFASMLPFLIVVGLPLGFALGWGWNGLLNLAVVRRYPAAPAAATGVTQAGLYAGGVLGPIAFGLLAATGSYPVAWLAFTAAMLTAGLIVTAATRRTANETPVIAGARTGGD